MSANGTGSSATTSAKAGEPEKTAVDRQLTSDASVSSALRADIAMTNTEFLNLVDARGPLTTTAGSTYLLSGPATSRARFSAELVKNRA